MEIEGIVAIITIFGMPTMIVGLREYFKSQGDDVLESLEAGEAGLTVEVREMERDTYVR